MGVRGGLWRFVQVRKDSRKVVEVRGCSWRFVEVLQVRGCSLKFVEVVDVRGQRVVAGANAEVRPEKR